MGFVIDVNALEAVARDHSDNKHIVRRDNLKMSLVGVRPHPALPFPTHEREGQRYYVLEGEGTIVMNDQTFERKPGRAVAIPPGVAHGVRNDSDRPRRYLDIFIDWAKSPGTGGY